MEELIKLIEKWAEERNFFDPDNGTNVEKQFIKLLEEVGELAADLGRGKNIKDDIGDIIVVLTIICKLKNIDLKECLEISYNEIKDRKGKFINKIYVKEQDLNKM